MSAAINKGLYRRLAGIEAIDSGEFPRAAAAQQTLRELLGHDGRLNGGTGSPAVYRGNWNKLCKDPCITYRQNTGLMDGRFTAESGRVADVYYDMEFWTALNGGDVLQYITECVEILIESARRLAPNLPIDTGVIHESFAIVEPVELYHSESNQWFTLTRYAFKEQRV